MTKTDTVTINGVSYDRHTGMKVSMRSPSRGSSVHAKAVHAKHSRTSTLKRSHLPSPHAGTPKHATHPKKVAQTTHKSPMIQKFAKPSTTTKPIRNSKVISDIAPVSHPTAVRAAHRVAQTKTQPAKKVPTAQRVSSARAPKPQSSVSQPTMSATKQSAITKALAKEKQHAPKKTSFRSRHKRLMSISTASLAIVLLAGYFTYINLPNLSVRVAAAQAGIAASYPTYQPSGYRLNGPVSYREGQVAINYAANSNDQKFTVGQTESSWDSSALLNNYVFEKSDGDYQTYSDNGLTIYVYNNNQAAWVNGGILHTIEGDATLSPDQIRKIATSM